MPDLTADGAGLIARQWSRTATITTVAAGFVVLVFAALPYLVRTGITQPMITLFLLVAMAVLWNLLAGYAGMISFGQQAYFGVGAYTVYLISKTGLWPFLAIGVGALAAAVAAFGIFFLLRYLTGGYFAVASWVVAQCLILYVSTQGWLGGATGIGLQQLLALPAVQLNAYTYWAALVVMVACVAGCYLLVRGKFGLDCRATKDEPTAAAAMGVEVQRTRRLAYLIAAIGAGAIGGVLLISNLYVDPGSIFSVNYSAEMLFMVVIGGIATMEGPLIGALIFFFAQEEFAGYGAPYLIAIGAIAILAVLIAPRGIWGTVSDRLGWSLLPVGYRVE